MKPNFHVLLFLLVPVISACSLNYLAGDGNVTSKTYQVGPFESVHTSSAIAVVITLGNEHHAELTTDANLMEHIEVQVQNGVLKVGTDGTQIRPSGKQVLEVTMTDVKELHASSASSIRVLSPIQNERVELHTSSAASLEAEVHVAFLEIESSSASSMTLRGTAGKVDASASSSGSVNGEKLTATDARLTASSSGAIDMAVNGELTASASSAGKVIYGGNPTKIEVSESSAGSVVSK